MLDDSCGLGLVVNNSSATMAIIGRQESRLERSYYKALHELQRLRKERGAELALLSQSKSREARPRLRSQETSSIQSPPGTNDRPGNPLRRLTNHARPYAVDLSAAAPANL